MRLVVLHLSSAMRKSVILIVCLFYHPIEGGELGGRLLSIFLNMVNLEMFRKLVSALYLIIVN